MNGRNEIDFPTSYPDELRAAESGGDVKITRVSGERNADVEPNDETMVDDSPKVGVGSLVAFDYGKAGRPKKSMIIFITESEGLEELPKEIQDRIPPEAIVKQPSDPRLTKLHEKTLVECLLGHEQGEKEIALPGADVYAEITSITKIF